MVATEYAGLIFALSVVVSLLSFVAAFFFLRVKKARVQLQILQEQRLAEQQQMAAEYSEHQVNIYRANSATPVSEPHVTTPKATLAPESTQATTSATQSTPANPAQSQTAKIKDLTSM